MKNFVFISPNFPTNYWQFCKELSNNGFRVLGIGDASYDSLSYELKEALADYYQVSSLENYDEVFRACGYYSFKYGHIDWLESNNEYWLEMDASLRTEFNINTGFKNDDMLRIKHKSEMKPYYEKVGIKTALYHIVDDYDGCKKFIKEVGYPVIVKPDNGVGASSTYKLKTDKDLKKFLEEKEEWVTYIMEEFLDATVNSYDAIIDSNGDPIFEAGNVTPLSIMDIVNNSDNSIYYIVKDLADDVREAGRKTAKSFGVKSRFVHFEFFRLNKDQRIGKKDEVVALEVNMRPCGGFTPDMINYARSTNVYKIWADMIANDKSDLEIGEHYYCAFVGRRDGKDFAFSNSEIQKTYQDNIISELEMPEALSDAMGNHVFIANFKTEKEMNSFYKKVLKLNK